MKHIRVEIKVSDTYACRNQVEVENHIFTTLAKAEIPMDASALMRGQLKPLRGTLSYEYFVIDEKWVFDWKGEA